jgi:hypothetical protein
MRRRLPCSHRPQGKNIKVCSPSDSSKTQAKQTSNVAHYFSLELPSRLIVMRFIVSILVVLAAEVVNAISTKASGSVIKATSTRASVVKATSTNLCEAQNNTICDGTWNFGCCEYPPLDGTMICTGNDADPNDLRWIFTPCVNGQTCLRPDEALPYCGSPIGP